MALPDPKVLTIISLGFGVIAFLLTLAQQLGEWRSKWVARILLAITCPLITLWIYYGTLRMTGFDLNNRWAWTIVGLILVGGVAMYKYFKRKNRKDRKAAKGPSGLEETLPHRGIVLHDSHIFNNDGAGIHSNDNIEIALLGGSTIHDNKGGGIVFDKKATPPKDDDPTLDAGS